MRLIAMVSTYVLSYLCVRWYGEEVYGNYVVFLGVFLQLAILGKFGQDLSITRFLSTRSEKVIPLELLKKILWVSLTVFIAFLGFVELIEYVDIKLFDSLDLKYTYSLGFFILFSFCLFFSGALRGIGKVSQFALLNITARPFLTLVALCIFYYLGQSNNDIFNAHIGAIIIVFLLSIFLLFYNKIKINKIEEDLTSYMKYNRLLFYSTLIYVVFTSGDRVLLKFLTDAATVAQYDIALKISMIMLIVSEAVNTYFSPKFAKEQEDYDRLQVIVKKSTRFMVLLSTLSFITILASGNFVLSLYGMDNSETLQSFIIVCSGFMLSALFGQPIAVIQMIGEMKGFIWKMMLIVIGSFGTAIVLTPQLGIIGMAIGFSSGYFALMFTAFLHLHHKTRINSFVI
jgi:O-antigen/teichoic acid export membrane protein